MVPSFELEVAMSMDHRLEEGEEMEAAEALGGLASFAAAGSWGKWRDRKRKRRGEMGREEERVEVESSLSCPYFWQKCATTGEDISEVPVKSELDSVLPDDRNIMCRTRCSSLGARRSKHNNLSETEKEAKRIQRVLANRESARRTIRRRQALCEDLTRRAAELTEENQRLMKGKALALKEYKSLKTTNKHLKAKD